MRCLSPPTETTGNNETNEVIYCLMPAIFDARVSEYLNKSFFCFILLALYTVQNLSQFEETNSLTAVHYWLQIYDNILSFSPNQKKMPLSVADCTINDQNYLQFSWWRPVIRIFKSFQYIMLVMSGIVVVDTWFKQLLKFESFLSVPYSKTICPHNEDWNPSWEKIFAGRTQILISWWWTTFPSVKNSIIVLAEARQKAYFLQYSSLFPFCTG